MAHRANTLTDANRSVARVAVTAPYIDPSPKRNDLRTRIRAEARGDRGAVPESPEGQPPEVCRAAEPNLEGLLCRGARRR